MMRRSLLKLFRWKRPDKQETLPRPSGFINIQALATTRDISALLLALGHRDGATRQAAKDAILGLTAAVEDDTAIQDRIVESLGSQDELVTSAVADILGKSIRLFESKLILALQQGNVAARWRSAEILGWCRCAAAASALAEAVRCDREDDVVEAAEWALKRLDGPEAERGLAEYRKRRASKQEASFEGTAVASFPHSQRTAVAGIQDQEHRQAPDVESAANMAAFSQVRDQNGVVRGIWLKNLDEAGDVYFLSMLAARIAKGGADFPKEYMADILTKKYRIAPNTYNASGGCFVMFGNARAPGEK